MATCKDCICYSGCSGILNDFGMRLNPAREVCDRFEDRSRFVELPCKVGDKIFCTTMGKIYQGIVGRIELDNEGFAIIATDGYCFDSSICYHTQEEAEQALKARSEQP